MHVIQLPPNYTDATLIGTGGMGSVYRARDTVMNRFVAVKIMTVPALSPEHLKRFSREAQSMSKLDHPNIIRVFSVGQLENSQPYMVLEYVDGKSLDQIIKSEGRIHGARAVAIFKQLASALACAHREGIVHRDVKPANVLIDGDQAKLADFGIARDLMRMTQATAPGAMIGSPMYASPEQCSGQSVDARSDIYSLGCLMFEILCGKPPFQSDNLLGLAMAHQTDPPPPLEGVPAGIARIVQRCLMKSPADRFADGAELLKAIEAGDTNVPEVVVERKREPRSRTALYIKIAFAALFGVALTYFLLQHRQIQSSRPSDTAEYVNKDRADADFERAKKMPDSEKAERDLLYAKAAREFELLGETVDASRKPEMYYFLGHVRLMQNDDHGAVAAFRHGIHLQRALKKRVPWRFLSGLATAYIGTHQLQDAERTLYEAINNGAREDPDTGFKFFSDYWIGRSQEEQEHYPQALMWYAKAQAEYQPSNWAGADIPEKARVAAQSILAKHPELGNKAE